MPDAADQPPAPHGTLSASQVIERKLATILSADVAEFSRLMSEDEEQTLRAFRGHKKIFEALVATHHGRVFNTAGDAILAEFGSAVEAVRCATDVQSALRTRNDQFPTNRQVRFRIGVNLGDVMIQGQDLLGDGVNLAARLQTAAEPGGICISGSVHDQIRNKLSLAFLSLGERNYKNISQPVRTFSIVESEGGVVLPSAKPRAAWKNPAIWAAAGVLIAAGAGYGAYALFKHGKLPPLPATTATNQAAPSAAVAPSPLAPPAATPAATPAVPKTPPTVSAPLTAARKTDAKPATVKLVAPAPAPATEPKPVAKSDSMPGPGASATPPVAEQIEAEPAPANAAPSRTADSQPTAKSEPPPQPLASEPRMRRGARAAMARNASEGRFDGVYAGQVCYEKFAALPHHCYHASGNVSGNKISGRWLIDKGPLTMYMEGRVAPDGDVAIEMHSDQPDGARVATINLGGTVRNGTILATGKFLRGRPASLDWHLQR
jgi:class 3 adenylate cyclase